jgi:hypothetical protein
MQYYNTCNVVAEDIDIKTHDPSFPLSLSPTNLNVGIKWPLGDDINRITPRWVINCVFSKIEANLRRSDYALLVHMIFENVLEATRNMDEWEKLGAGEGGGLHTSHFVLFPYDVKNGTPTT